MQFFPQKAQRILQQVTKNVYICKCVATVRNLIFTHTYIYRNMSLFRVILAIIFPPLAVVDKGCGSFLIIFILTALGWVPGVIGALVILNKE